MRKLLALPLALTAAFSVAGCIDSDAPSRRLDVVAPDWAEGVNVKHVSKYSASVIDAQGDRLYVSRSGTALGQGLTASRDYYDLYVTDGTVTCNWNSGEQLDWCRTPNPAYAEYKAARAAERAAKR